MEMEISSLQQQVMATNQSMEESMLSKKQQEKKVRPQQDQALKCPRCQSTNTKFCYYNNYSLSQPRYFCKGCRRYWTQGGSLRKVPVGGGCRKNKKQTPNSSKNKPQDHDRALPMINPNIDHLLPTLSYDPTDLTLTFARLHNQQAQNPNPNGEGFLDILRNGFLGSTNYTNGFNNLCDFDGGVLPLMSSGASTTIVEDNGEGRCKALDINGGEQWQLSDENNKNNSTDVDVGSARDYWNGMVHAIGMGSSIAP